MVELSSLMRDLVLVILGLLFLVLGRLLLTRVVPRLSARTELSLLQDLARMAVAAAEAMGHRRGWSGEEKYRLAEQVVREALARAGVEVTEEEVRAAIEQAVMELKSFGYELK